MRRLTWRTAVDKHLCHRTGLDELTLRRLRRALMRTWHDTNHNGRTHLSECGTFPRFRLLVNVMRLTLTTDQWLDWLAYLEHTQDDVNEMCRGEYPISPWLIRLYSAVFGIKVDFLLLGDAPTAEPRGVPIEVMPILSAR